MTYLARMLIVTAFTVAPGFVLAQDYSGVVTGPNGGTAAYVGNCTAADGVQSCSRNTVLTGPEGYTANRTMDRTRTKEGVTTKFTTTGQFGRTVTTTRERLR